MRNIILSNFESYPVNNVDKCTIYHVCENHVLLYDKGKILKLEENDGDTSTTEICNLTDTLYPVSNDTNNLVPDALDITYSFEKNSIFLILQNGDIVAVELEDNHVRTSDVIGSISGGLKACKWSPENEFVALVTGTDNVMVMTNDFYPVSEVELHSGGFGEKQFTTVGWGKKETQFRGSEGKYKAQVNPEPETKSEIYTDNSVKISWRGDAEYFVISSKNPENGERYLRIFSKEGVLQYTSEIVPGLEHSLDWRPSGNLIASTQRLPNKHNICFFEKNGLKHGEFTLPFKQNEIVVKELMWNQDSKLLAVLIEGLVINETIRAEINEKSAQNISGEQYILIYCVNNYHWYCKYSIPFGINKELIMKWDQKSLNCLHVLINEENNVIYNKYSWLWSVNKSGGISEKDRSFVAVIDGSKLLLTSFKNGILPPPMCTYSLEMPCQINQVGFAPIDDPEITSNNLFVHLSNGQTHVYKFECSEEKSDQISHKLIGVINSKPEFIYNINWVSSKTFASCEKNNNSLKYYLNIMDLQNFEANITYKEKKYEITSPITILRSCSESCVVFHDNSGSTYLFQKDTENFSQLSASQKRALVEMEVIQKKDGSFIVFGLDKSNKFFINGNLITNNITSFHIHQEFLLLTNLKHRLLCVPIEADHEKIIGAELNEVSSRRIERGSRLVTSVLKDTKVILQMPRGNLECIQPRALSFSVIGKFLDALQYFEAFNIMRQQRINLNLLYDHNPELFVENIEIFIDQIKDPNWLSLFLSDLVDEDVTRTMYSVIYKRKEILNAINGKSKIVTVCELLEKELEKEKYSDKYVLPVLTTYIKRGETHYVECALRKIKKLKDAENNGSRLTVTFDEAFRYTLYLIDVEELYKVALGMYDFDLVLLVATKSQKDPKEYLPFLNNLRKLEVNYQKFMIDKHLKRYEKALKHLLQCGGDDFFTECLTFIKAHKLYKTALKLVPHTTDRYKQICSNYADELLKLHLYEEAGIMFAKSGSYTNAIAAFTRSGNWQEVISCTMKLQLTNEEKNEVYVNLAGELVERKRFREASIVYMDYLKNTDMAVMALTLGRMFSEAFRIAELTQRDDLVQDHIKPSVMECYRNTSLQISSFGELFAAQSNRLRIVREKKLLQIKDSFEGEELSSDQDSYSESSTVVTQSYAGSRTTNRTFRSAKNKRKQERKLLSLKEGSPFEDLALIASLHSIVTNCLELRTEIRELNKSLVKINEEPSAEKLEKALEELLKDIEMKKCEIWTPDLLSGKQTYGPDATSNSIAASFTQSEISGPVNLINPRLLIPPETQSNTRWQLEILKA